MNIGYLISTHKNYQEPCNQLLSSMYASGVSDKNILVVSAGHDTEWQTNDYLNLNVTHNSFDYTSWIEYVKIFDRNNIKDWTHVFPLHDTMLFGKNTHELINSVDPEKWCTAVWGGQCNLMLVKREYMLQYTEQVLSWTNVTKKLAIELEGHLFRACPVDQRSFYPGNIEERGIAFPYNGSPRLVEYYNGIDLIKYKANYGQTNEQTFITAP